jgi:hypothetical protein
MDITAVEPISTARFKYNEILAERVANRLLSLICSWRLEGTLFGPSLVTSIASLLKQQMVITIYCLPTKKNKLLFSVYLYKYIRITELQYTHI